MGSRKKYMELNRILADVPDLLESILRRFVRRGYPGITTGPGCDGDLYVKHGILLFVESLCDYIVKYNEPHVSYTASAETEFDCLIEVLKNTKHLRHYAEKIESLIREILKREIFVMTKSAYKRV
jgi:hypothetical protein